MSPSTRNPPIDVPAVDPASGRWMPVWFDRIKYLDGLDPLSSVDFSAVYAAIALKSDIVRSINDQSGTSYTFTQADSGNYCRFTNAGAVTVTVPPHSSVALPARAQIDLIQSGAGKVTIAAGAGVTINSLAGNKSLAGQYAGATLIQTNVLDTWDLVGNLLA